MPQSFGQKITYPKDYKCPNCKSTPKSREGGKLHLRASGWHCGQCDKTKN